MRSEGGEAYNKRIKALQSNRAALAALLIARDLELLAPEIRCVAPLRDWHPPGRRRLEATPGIEPG
jgi:hypothetical protein